MNNEILNFCLKKGFLVDKDVLNIFNGDDPDSIKLMIDKIGSYTQKKFLTKTILFENKEIVNQFFSDLPSEKQQKLENFKIKLGLSIEISRKRDIVNESQTYSESCVKVDFAKDIIYKKLEVKDFVIHFRNRFSEMKGFLLEHSELKNLISINKLQGNYSNVSIIGLVSEIRRTKNNNIILKLEDLTGKINVLINKNKKELIEKVEELALDSVISAIGSGSRDIFFANDIFFPDSCLPERKKAEIEEYALFIGDLHFGSKRFLRKSFLKFIDYLNGNFPNTPEVNKIKYLFLVGDIVTGVGNYPNQEYDLEIKNLEEQFIELAKLLKNIRKDIKIIISPGNHDGVRLMEPQPILDEKFAWPLYDLENVIMTGNPSYVNIGARKNFSGFDVLTYHGCSFPYFANNVTRLLVNRAMNTPDEITKYLLKHRHLAPTHASWQYCPLEKDALIIRKIPDIIVTAHTHKSAVSYYNNILIISTSCWEAMTPYQEKFGNLPDHCKVPMLNLKTRAVKILDFEEQG
jgi:DNA polymerase II small subunit